MQCFESFLMIFGLIKGPSLSSFLQFVTLSNVMP